MKRVLFGFLCWSLRFFLCLFPFPFASSCSFFSSAFKGVRVLLERFAFVPLFLSFSFLPFFGVFVV